MFELIDKLSYSDATQVVYYAISEIQNPHINSIGITNRVSDENRKIARVIINKITSSRRGTKDKYVNELYNKLLKKAEEDKMYYDGLEVNFPEKLNFQYNIIVDKPNEKNKFSGAYVELEKTNKIAKVHQYSGLRKCVGRSSRGRNYKANTLKDT